MSQDFRDGFGNLIDNGEIIVYEVQTERAKLITAEQLDELKRDDDLFLKCQHSIVDENWIKIYFKRNHEYQRIQTYIGSPIELKITISENLFKLNRLIGTQFTTTLHPDNIYINRKGDVKLAHRGIRHVLPPFDFNEEQLLSELKDTLVYLFTGYLPKDDNKLFQSDMEIFVNRIYEAKSMKELLHIIHSSRVSSEEMGVSGNIPEKVVKNQKEKQNSKKLSLLSGILIGFLFGLVFLYVTQVIPLTEASSNNESILRKEQKVYEDEKKDLQQRLADLETINQAYSLSLVGEKEEAIKLLESVKNLPADGHDFLSTLYLESDNVIHLQKAAAIDEKHHRTVVEKLLSLKSDEANESILNIESDDPYILIEQAWINKQHDRVIELYNDTEKNERTKLLAANSYLELNKPEEALALGKELNAIAIQISSIEKQIEIVNANKDLKGDEKKDRLEELNEQLQELSR